MGNSTNLAVDLLDRITAALDHGPSVFISLAGGTTPRTLTGILSEHPRSQTIDWSAVTVVPTDERCVDASDPASNHGTLQRIWLNTPLERVRIWDLVNTPLCDLGQQPFAAVVLGMGLDGHTASLFPQDARPAATDPLFSGDPTLGVETTGQPPVARISLSLPTLLNSSFLALLIAGQEKQAALQRSLNHDPPLPIKRVFQHAQPPVRLYLDD